MALNLQEWADLHSVVLFVVVTLPIITAISQALDHSAGTDLTAVLNDIVIVNLSVQDGDPLRIAIEAVVAVDLPNATAVDLIAVGVDMNEDVTAQVLTDLILGLDATLINIAVEDVTKLDVAIVPVNEDARDLVIGRIAVAVLNAVTKKYNATTITVKDVQEKLTVTIAADLNLAAVEIRKIVIVMIVWTGRMMNQPMRGITRSD